MRLCSTLVASVALGQSALAQNSGKKLNVLFFAVDDLRYQLHEAGPGVIGPGCPVGEGTGCTKMVTPHLDALAAESTLFMKNYVQQAVCSPTRTSLLTGRRPDTTHVYDLYSYYRDVSGNFTTIPEFFRLQGYYTAGMGKIFHPGHASGLNASKGRGGDDTGFGPGTFSWSVPYFHAPNLGYWSGQPTGGNRDRSWMAVPAAMEKAHPLPDSQTADHAVATLQQLDLELDEATPFFLACGFHKPHLPFVFPEAKLDLYPLEEIRLPTDQQPPKNMPLVAWSSYGELLHYADAGALNASGAPGTVLPPDYVKELRRAYYAAVSHTDDQVGKVMAALKASRFADNTVVSIWGDHGWQLGEHGEWCKHTNFELATRELTTRTIANPSVQRVANSKFVCLHRRSLDHPSSRYGRRQQNDVIQRARGSVPYIG